MSNTSVTREEAETSSCPFCAKRVDATLVLYGGQCPFCFGEIPGEEAPTDPGEEKKKADLAIEKKKVERSRLVPALIASLVPLCVIGVAGVILYRSYTQVMPVLDLDAAEYDMDIAPIVAAPAQVADNGSTATTPKPGTKPASKPSSSKPSTADNPYATMSTGSKLMGDGSTPAIQANNGGTSAPDGGIGPKGPKAGTSDMPSDMGFQGTSGTSGPTGVDNMGDLGVHVSRIQHSGVQLTDDNQIIEMAKAVVGDELPKLRTCYERELKGNDALAGRWLIQFTVNTDGSVKGASATGQDMQDANLEQCIVQKVGQWQFQPIKESLPVKKSVTFRPS